jgi:hypothetical protein
MNADPLEQAFALDTQYCEVCEGERSITLPDGTVVPCDWCGTEVRIIMARPSLRMRLAILAGLTVACWALIGGFFYVVYRAARWILGGA